MVSSMLGPGCLQLHPGGAIMRLVGHNRGGFFPLSGGCSPLAPTLACSSTGLASAYFPSGSFSVVSVSHPICVSVSWSPCLGCDCWIGACLHISKIRSLIVSLRGCLYTRWDPKHGMSAAQSSSAEFFLLTSDGGVSFIAQLSLPLWGVFMAVFWVCLPSMTLEPFAWF